MKGEGRGASSFGDVTLVVLSLRRKFALSIRTQTQVAIYIEEGLVRSNRFISGRI